MLPWHDIFGILGVALIVGAYLLLQLDRLDSRAPAYSASNAAGAGLILVSLIVDFNLSAFVIESFWILISLAGLYRSMSTRYNAHHDQPSTGSGET